MQQVRGHGRGRARMILVSVLLLSGVVSALYWHYLRSPVGSFALHEQVPVEADELAWIDSWGEVATGLRRLAARIRGAGGVAEAVAIVAGLEGLEITDLESVGLMPEAGAAVFRFDGALWGITEVDGRRGAEHILGVLERRGLSVSAIEPLDEGARWWRVGGRGQGDDSRLYLRLQGDLLALRWRLGAEADDVAAAWERWRVAPRREVGFFSDRPGALHGVFALDPALGLQKAARRAMGPATLLFGRLVDRFQRVELDLTLDAERPALRLALRTAPGAAKDVADYHQGFLVEEQGLLSLGDLLPDEVALLLRARVNPGLLDMVPRILRDRLIPASLLGQIHPSLGAIDIRSALIDQLDGQLVLGLLGVDDKAPPDPRRWVGRGLRKTVGAVAAVSMKTEQAAQSFLTRVRGALTEAGAKAVALKLGRFSGFSLELASAPWSLLRSGRALVWISGEGELRRFERAAQGRFPTLGAVATSPLERSVLRGDGQWVGGLLTTGRLVRSLRRRGIPDHFVSMLASVVSVSAGLSLQPDGATLRLELRPKVPNSAEVPK